MVKKRGEKRRRCEEDKRGEKKWQKTLGGEKTAMMRGHKGSEGRVGEGG